MRAWRVAVMLLAAVQAGCAAQAGGFAWSRRRARVDRVAVGDTMEQVRRALGEPGGVALDSLPQGQERVIWYYPASATATRSLEGRVQTAPRDPVVLEHARSVEAGSAGLNRVIFVNGHVAEIRVPAE